MSCSSPEAVTNSARDTSRDDLAMPVEDAGVDAARPVGDSLPQGAVSFFNRASCPLGWEPFASAAGRTIVPSAGKDPAGPGSAVGEPLLDSEDRGHGHAIKATVELPTVSYVGIAGEANHGLGRGGSNAIVGTTGKASAGLPYVQLLACNKTAAADPWQKPPPAGLLMFFAADSCPAGWEQAGLSQGRFLVGMPDVGTPQAFGGRPLGAGEKRGHRHEVSGAVQTSSHGIALLSGGGAGGYAKDGRHAYQVSTDEESASPPYVSLLQCQKK